MNENKFLRRKAKVLLEFLRRKYKRYVENHVARKEGPFKLLIATILSQRTRDENTAKAARKLFSLASTPEKMLKLDEKTLETAIKVAGMYRQKAKRIREVCRILLRDFKGRVPDRREELLKLPGVGFKTSDVVLCYGFGVPTIPVDVHVEVFSKRFGLVNEKAGYEEIRKTLERLIPERDRYLVNLALVKFGKDVCRTRNPKCEMCEIKEYCDYYRKRK